MPQARPGRGGAAAGVRRPTCGHAAHHRSVSYQVLARKYRPQRFDEVVGQQGVTQTLRNAIAGGRLAQAFIFAGAARRRQDDHRAHPRQGAQLRQRPHRRPVRRLRRLRRDRRGPRHRRPRDRRGHPHRRRQRPRGHHRGPGASRPARDRYKIFIIDEVHQLSEPSFNALLKSIEEPPPHVVFMMATTELHKIPDTIRSRSQEFEFRTIGTPRHRRAAARRSPTAERLDVEPAALALVARAAEGSMRDAESSLDQVIAFAGETITADDVAAVLGLVGRDLLLDMVETVADEDAPRVFDLAARAVEAGHDLRLLCRELARVVRDMMVVGIDPSRGRAIRTSRRKGDVERLKALAARFSREDLLRAFDVRRARRIRGAHLGAAALPPRDGAAAVDAPAASSCRSPS